jgi:protein-S-isoprenylcysteine O-methyltransferase Ste14
MSTLRTSIWIAWLVFWVYWLISAAGAKKGRRSLGSRCPGLLIALPAVVLIRTLGPKRLAVHDPALEALGTILFACGLALAVWARVHLGRNWGMPMTRKDEPELVTSGPYRLVRHPIYSGILVATVGTALATNIYWLITFAVAAAYFAYSATVEERLLTDAFPSAYPGYKGRTKMLIPFVL